MWANGEADAGSAQPGDARTEMDSSELGEMQDFQVKVLSRLVKKDHRSLIAAARLHQEAFRLHGESPLMGPRATFDLHWRIR